MPNASEAILYYEADQAQVAITELTDQGDHLDYRSGDTLWSGFTGKTPVVTPNGVYDGGVITPAVSGSNDVVDISACRAYIAGVLTTVAASTDEAIVRPAANDYQKFSITITSGGAFAVVDGTEHTAFSTVRGANGGPPYIPATSIEPARPMYQAFGGRGRSTIPQILSVIDVKSLSPRISGERFPGVSTVLSSDRSFLGFADPSSAVMTAMVS